VSQVSLTGVRLATILERVAVDPGLLPDNALLELLGLVVRSVAALHESSAGAFHGALNPAHIVITRDGVVLLLECDLGPQIAALEQNREQLWREFGLAFPPSATLPRFDRRADVTQLAAIALALTLRRPLRADEYPRGIGDLVMAATTGTQGEGQFAPALRVWLQQALKLDVRGNFTSAGEAEQALSRIFMPPTLRRAGAPALRTLLHICCEPAPAPVPVRR